jgi:hypothetical protein
MNVARPPPVARVPAWCRPVAIAGLLSGWLAPAHQAQDVVVLQDGTRVEGRVVFESQDKVVVRMGTKDREIEHAKVASVESILRSLHEALKWWDELEPTNLTAILDLARFCKSRGLEGEASVFAHRVLAADPKNEEAHLFLEHEKRGDGWIARDGNKRVPYTRLLELRKDFGDAWKFSTTHYDLTTNLDLEMASDLAIELELFYRTYYDWFGIDLGLYDVVDPMACNVHADKASYPESTGRTAYFDNSNNVLVELAPEGLLLEVLIHEAMHQLFHNTANETRKGGGAIPPWLNEGMAEVFSVSRTGVPGRARYDGRTIKAEHFVCHRAAKNPYDLGRILTFNAGDYGASSKADLKYAQSYTLVQFCLTGEGGAHRDSFLEFLRGAYQGKGSSSDFKSAIGSNEREFEKAWSEFVKNGS